MPTVRTFRLPAALFAVLLVVESAHVARAVDGPASLGQQPLVVLPEPDLTPAQLRTNQFNQLFNFEATPDICAAGEGYLSGQFAFLGDYHGADGVGASHSAGDELRVQAQGQYGITDQVAVGGSLPFISNPDGVHGGATGFGDVDLFGQYKFDQIIAPSVFDLTAQLDVVLPTGSGDKFRDRGKFGVRPLALAYKDFGQVGPGTLGAYGLFGLTFGKHVDVHMGVAVTYEIQHFAGVLELTDIQYTRPDYGVCQITPGVIYHGIEPFEFALGLPIGIGHDAPKAGIEFKVTYAFAK
jgi:hypothetical protein